MFYSFLSDQTKIGRVTSIGNTTIASQQILKRGSTLAAINSTFNTLYPLLPYIFWTLWTWGFIKCHIKYNIMLNIPIKKIEQIAIEWLVFGLFLLISEVGSSDYIAKSAILKMWVFWVISMHYITLYVIETLSSPKKSLVFRKFGLRKYVLVSTKFVSEKDLGFGIGKFGLGIKMSWLQ